MAQATKLALSALLLAASLVIAWRYDVDGKVFYTAAKLATENRLEAVYSDDVSNLSAGKFYYSPIALVALYPLALMPYSAFRIVWMGLQVFSFLLLAYSLCGLFPWLKQDRSKRFAAWPSPWWFCAYIFFLNPVHSNFQSGNISLMLGTSVVAGEYLLRRFGRKGAFGGGLLVGLAAAVKVFPGFVALFYLLFRSQPTRLGLVAAGFVSALAPVLLFGFEDTVSLWRAFFDALGKYENDNSLITSSDIQSLPSFLVRGLFFPRPWVTPLCAALAFAFFLWAWKNRSEAKQNIIWWLQAMALTVFLNPSSRPHYFVFYFPAMVFLCEQAKANRKLQFTVVGIVLTVCFTAQGVAGKHWNDVFEFWNIPTLGLFALILNLVYHSFSRLKQ